MLSLTKDRLARCGDRVKLVEGDLTTWIASRRPLPVQGVLRLLEDGGLKAAALDLRGDRGMLVGRRPV
ncbi:MAG: hypothetical protein E6J51_09220 [Chloroflexi bacterium]|nr:MAG: hypothetical protein E6J51_09220 [Chloroflexota bacterium]